MHYCLTHKLSPNSSSISYFRGGQTEAKGNFKGSYYSRSFQTVWRKNWTKTQKLALRWQTFCPKTQSQVWCGMSGVSRQHENADRQECLPWLVSDALFVVVPRWSALIVEEGHFTLVGGGGGEWGRGRGRGFVVRMKSRGCSPFVSSFPWKTPAPLPWSVTLPLPQHSCCS